MKKYTKKFFENALKEYVRTYDGLHMKANALRELNDLEKSKGIKLYFCRELINQYEDFDHFRFRIGREGKEKDVAMIAIFCLSYGLLKQFKDKDYKNMAKQMYGLYKDFGGK